MKPKANLFFCCLIFLTLLTEGCGYLGNSLKDPVPASDAVSEHTLVAEVLMHLQLDYIDSEKLEPELLLEGALTELERMVPEVWVETQLHQSDSIPTLQVNVGNEKTVLSIMQLQELYDLHLVLQKLKKHLLQMDLQLTKSRIEQIFANGILHQLDEYSVLLPKEIFHEFNINLGGHFAGVGLVVGMRDGYLTVIAPMDGSPASKAGMLPLDKIVEVDGEKTEHMTLDEILHRLRGEIGSPVKLSVLRKGHSKALQFVLHREQIQVESVVIYELGSEGKSVKYARIKNFQIETSQELKNKLGDLKNTEGLILDLRNNPGGLLEEAVKVSDLFLEWKKRIVSTKSSLESTTHYSKQLFANENYLTIPIIVLINHGSASASEIVAAALQQNERAIVIGQPSFGKGTVQTVWDLKKGYGLKLTVGEYLTPSGHSIHRIGVVPNLQLNPVSIPVKKADSQNVTQTTKTFENQNLPDLQSPVDLERFYMISGFEGEKTNNSEDSIKIRYLSRHSKQYDESQIVDKNVITDKLKEDIAIETARRALMHWNTGNIKSVLQQISREIEQKELAKITGALAVHGIDWSLNPFLKSPAGENLKLSWSAETISDDLLQLDVQLKNEGLIDAQRLIIVTKSSNGLLDGLEFPIGRLLPEKIETRSVNINISAGMMDETEPVELIIFDHNFQKIKSFKEQLIFLEKPVTFFRVSMKIFDNGKFGSEGNGDGKVQSGETIALSFKITNMSKKLIPELMFYIKGTEGSFRINRGKIVLKNLYPEIDQKDFFLFQVKSNSSRLGKIIMEMDAKNSGAPKISKLWVLDNLLPEKQVLTPVFVDLKWQDLDGNIVKGETLQDTLMFSGKVKNAGEVRDLYVHLNDKKVFYTANLNHHNEFGDKIDNNREFPFKTVINLSPGINQISVFSRGRHGFTSERKLRMLKRH